MNTEPVLTLGGVTAASLTVAVVAMMGLAQAFGWHDFSDEQKNQAGLTIAALWAVIIPLGLAIRSVVFAPSTVQKIKTELATAPPVDSATAEALAK